MSALKEILFPSDLSAASDRAFEHARFLAEAFGARLTLYHAASLPVTEYAAWAAGREDEVWKRVEGRARQELERRVQGLRTPFDTVVRHDVPGMPLLADLAILKQVQATHPDLVVMATRSREGFDRFFGESASRRPRALVTHRRGGARGARRRRSALPSGKRQPGGQDPRQQHRPRAALRPLPRVGGLTAARSSRWRMSCYSVGST